MLLSSLALGAVALASSSAATPLKERQSSSGNIGLSINGSRFSADYLQTYRISYANSSAYIGEIKYQAYSEPLVVAGAGIDGAGDGLSFLSIHSSPTGYQDMYVVPGQTKPVAFSVPHGSAPSGVRTTGFSIDHSSGVLLNNGLDLFYACQDAAQAAISTYQIWWVGAAMPTGVSCKGPLGIMQSDPCARS